MLALGMFASSLYAGTSDKAYHFSIGAGGWFKKGISNSNPNMNMNERQKGYDIFVGLQRFKADSFYADLNIDYKGFNNKTFSTLVDGKNIFYDANLMLGYAFGVGDSFAITPFIGAGSGSSKLEIADQNGGYFVRKVNYGAAGIRFDSNLSASLDLGLLMQISRPLSDPKLQTNLTKTSMGVDATSDLVWKMKKNYNYKVELPITYTLAGSSNSFRLTPYFETEKLGDVNSGPDVGGSALEGSSVSDHVWGAKVAYVFSY